MQVAQGIAAAGPEWLLMVNIFAGLVAVGFLVLAARENSERSVVTLLGSAVVAIVFLAVVAFTLLHFVFPAQ